MSKVKIVVIVCLLLFFVVVGVNLLSAPDEESEPVDDEPAVVPDGIDEEPEPPVDRESLIPADAVKVMPESDPFPPILHSPLWEEPVPMPYPVTTAGAEDSPFVAPCGCAFYWFFTPDASLPAELQLGDGVTGIYYAARTEEGWGEPRKLELIEEDVSLDGCPWVGDGEIWFCSVRRDNLREIDIWIADMSDGNVTNIRNGGVRLNSEIGLGELHVTSDGDEIYFHSDMPGGVGGRDIWVTRRVDGEWLDAENVEGVNTEGSDSLPFVTEDGRELWFTRWYMGYPAVYVSRKVGGAWSEPELIVSQFAAEPTLDVHGNLYFAHHFIQDGVMIEADIYVAYRKRPLEPVDAIPTPGRGYYVGVLPTPAEGQSFEEAHRQASETSEVVPVWGRPTPFHELAGDLAGGWGDVFVGGMIRGNGMMPLVHLSFMDVNLTLKTPPGLEGATLSDPGWRRAYKESVADVVEASRPLYLSVGNEVNRWYERHGLDGPNGFSHWVSLYHEIHDMVEALSPGTQVFCTFSREVVDENREADMSVLRLFDPERMDMLVLTSYPFSLQGINRPSDIPDDYYLEASIAMPGKPLGFSETAWPSVEAFGGEQGQADFLGNLTTRLTMEQGIELRLLAWSWLHDLGADEHTGLLSWDGSEKAAYQVWRGLASSAE
jgi:hypothetical protein